MHTTEIGEAVFIHHGDYSGAVTIRSKGGEVTILNDHLLAFVARQIRNELIAALEETPDDLILRRKPRRRVPSGPGGS